MRTTALALLLAAAPLSKAAAGAPDNATPAAALAEAEALAKSNRFEQAVALLQQTLKRAPKLVDGWVQLGNVQLNLGQNRQAIAAYQRALTLDSNLHDVRYNLAYALRSMGDHKAAIGAYQTYLKGAPKDPDALFGLAESLKGDAQWSAAADAFERYADAEDRPTQTRWATYARKEAADLRAKNRTNEVTTEAALAEVPTVDDTPSVATVTDIDDEDAPAIGALSDEDRAQIVPEAPPSDDQQAAPTRAQRRPPTFREGLKHLRAGDFARALRPLARAAEASPNDPIVLSALGSAHLGVSNAKAALITYRRALALEPVASMVSALHFGIGEAQRMAGDDASARVALMQVVSADATPDHLKKLARARLDALR